MKVVRVLVVDDSPTMRQLVSRSLSRDPQIEVVGSAGSASEARELIKKLSPDIITLDVEMPGMNGLEFLDKIMTLRPMPVVMVSTLTETGSKTAIEALEIGAIDCVVKPSADNPSSFDELPLKVKAASQAKVRHRANHGSTPSQGAILPIATSSDKVVAIGSSTGGVEALMAVLSRFPPNCAPTVITQHMPSLFTASLALRLNKYCPATVSEARHGAELKHGHVYLAPGGGSHLEVVGHRELRCSLKAAPPVNGHCPSVDVLFASVAKSVGKRGIGVILTGMGRDGAQGLKKMRDQGARTVGQDCASSVVYGMPKAAFELGAVEKQCSLAQVGDEITALMSS